CWSRRWSPRSPWRRPPRLWRRPLAGRAGTQYWSLCLTYLSCPGRVAALLGVSVFRSEICGDAPAPRRCLAHRDARGQPRAARVERPELAATDHHMRQALKLVALRHAAVRAAEHARAELLVRDKDVAVDLDANECGRLVLGGVVHRCHPVAWDD